MGKGYEKIQGRSKNDQEISKKLLNLIKHISINVNLQKQQFMVNSGNTK